MTKTGDYLVSREVKTVKGIEPRKERFFETENDAVSYAARMAECQNFYSYQIVYVPDGEIIAARQEDEPETAEPETEAPAETFAEDAETSEPEETEAPWQDDAYGIRGGCDDEVVRLDELDVEQLETKHKEMQEDAAGLNDIKVETLRFDNERQHLNKCRTEILEAFRTAEQSFLVIGKNLCEIADCGLYKCSYTPAGVCKDIYEYAKFNFDIARGTCNNYMNIIRRFGITQKEDGQIQLQEPFNEYNVSQLVAMLPLQDTPEGRDLLKDCMENDFDFRPDASVRNIKNAVRRVLGTQKLPESSSPQEDIKEKEPKQQMQEDALEEPESDVNVSFEVTQEDSRMNTMFFFSLQKAVDSMRSLAGILGKDDMAKLYLHVLEFLSHAGISEQHLELLDAEVHGFVI